LPAWSAQLRKRPALRRRQLPQAKCAQGPTLCQVAAVLPNLCALSHLTLLPDLQQAAGKEAVSAVVARFPTVDIRFSGAESEWGESVSDDGVGDETDSAADDAEQAE